MARIEVNAVGENCPIPVVKATKALASMKEPGTLAVRVDNEVAVENLLRLASGKGLPVKNEKLGDALYLVTMEVETLPVFPAQNDTPDCEVNTVPGNTVVVISNDAMGTGDDALGRQLLKGFLYALSQQETLPKTILFYNGGAKMTCTDSPSLPDLKAMEEQGVEILTCGTCLNHYGLTEKLAVGGVTNMYAIVEKMTGASLLVKP